MKHCDTLITLTENLGRGWEGDWGVQTPHVPCPVFPAPAPFLVSSLKPLCKAAIIEITVALFSSISPASLPFRIITSRPFLSLTLTLHATYARGLPPPWAPPPPQKIESAMTYAASFENLTKHSPLSHS